MTFWTHQMLSAIAFLHQKQVCHRDVKPDNFLVAQPSSGPPSLKLADMGLAVQCPPGSLLSDKCGTPAFMAPEQHLIPQRSKGYGLQVDVWAVGVSMYMLMFGGRHPFLNARGALNKANMLEGTLDFREVGGFLGSFGMAGMRMSEEARNTCQAMVCPDLRARLTSQAALATVGDMWQVRSGAAPAGASPSIATKKSEGSAGARANSPGAVGGTASARPAGLVKDRGGLAYARRKLDGIKDCVAIKMLPGAPTRRAPSVDRRGPSAAKGGGGPPPGVPLWEFSARDGFVSYQAEAHEVLEKQYQTFLEGKGPPICTVATLGQEVEVDFHKMEQQVKNHSGRKRKVRRNAPGAP